jgi:hypothetical protein
VRETGESKIGISDPDTRISILEKQLQQMNMTGESSRDGIENGDYPSLSETSSEDTGTDTDTDSSYCNDWTIHKEIERGRASKYFPRIPMAR